MSMALLAISPSALTSAVQIGLPVSVALAAVALIGYIFGQRTRSSAAASLDERRQQELDRAVRTAHQLEVIAETLRRSMNDASRSSTARSAPPTSSNSWPKHCVAIW